MSPKKKTGRTLPAQPVVKNSSYDVDDTLATKRDIGIQIELTTNNQFFLIPTGTPFTTGKFWACPLKRDPQKVYEYVSNCQKKWLDELVNLKVRQEKPGQGNTTTFPFQDDWDQSSMSQETLQSIGAQLAFEGQKLFRALFREDGNDTINEIGHKLSGFLSSGSRVISILSDSCFVPWSLIYTHPDGELNFDGSNFVWEGFWGYSHIIEHNTKEAPTSELSHLIKAMEDGRVQTSLNFDRRVDDGGIDCIRPQLKFFEETAKSKVSVVQREKKSELGKALSSKPFEDALVYFCCHGKGGLKGDAAASTESATLALGDGQAISRTDIEAWLDGRHLESEPMVFINACQGGQVSTIFYETLVPEFLRRKASCVLGPQIDIPAVFAKEYALRFFDGLFGIKNQPERVGSLMQKLTREFILNHRNPLGLVYSLYRGIDCSIKFGEKEIQ